jgi:hypothetical protein
MRHQPATPEDSACVREIYDGHYVRAFGASADPKALAWQGKLTLLASCLIARNAVATEHLPGVVPPGASF